MVDVWLDAVTPKDSLLLHTLLPSLHEKGYKTLVTAKEQTQTTDILNLLGVPYTRIGKYGETLKTKLLEEQKRTLSFVDLFDKMGYPKVLWTHGDVSAIRTAFGLGIPIVYANDTPHAIHVAKLVSPLVDWLIAPLPYGKSWSKFGLSKQRIILYDGIEEVAWMGKPRKRKPALPKELPTGKPVVLFRNAEYKASYCQNVKVDPWDLVKKLAAMSTVIFLPRYEEEKEKLKTMKNVWVPEKPILAFELMPSIDLVIASGGTICRESTLDGIPTINFHFWDAIARYLGRKGFPIKRIADAERILNSASRILRDPMKHRVETHSLVKRLENPVAIITRHIERILKK